MRGYHIRVALMLGAAVIPGIAHAQAVGQTEEERSHADQEDDRIVVTATRTPLSIENAPATVTVIDSEEIADHFVTDLKDLVRYEPGVTVRRAPARFGAALGTTGRARNEDIAIRGIGGNRVLIQVDGIRSPQGFTFGAQDAGRLTIADRWRWNRRLQGPGGKPEVAGSRHHGNRCDDKGGTTIHYPPQPLGANRAKDLHGSFLTD